LSKPRWIEIQGCNVKFDTLAKYPRKKVRKTAKVEDFCILWAPVTVRDYLPFVKKGYAQDRWWDGEALEWANAEREDLRAASDFRSAGDRRPTAPANWARQIHHPNHPVVGVSWYEARAFCRWAMVNWRGLPRGWLVDLPSESEWHCAAFGLTDDLFPWGDDPPGVGDAARASYIHGGAPDVGTPVGAFPSGNRNGIVDLVGNTWEWCSDVVSVTDGRVVKYSTMEVGGVGVLKGSCGHGRLDGRKCRDDVVLAPLTSRTSCHGFRVVLRPSQVVQTHPTTGKKRA